jgi:long-subunit fatty acid transport protein
MMALILSLTLVGIDPSAGTAGFDFLNVAPTAREAAMAGATAGTGGGAMSFWYNPAHLPAAEGPRAHVGYLNYVAGIHHGSVGYSQPVGADKAVGIGVVYLNSGLMKRTDEQGRELGTFGVSYADVNVSGAMTVLPGLNVGIAVQGLYGSIDTFFTLGLAGNVGARYSLPVPGLSAGLGAQNLGLQLKAFADSADPLPLEFALGLAYQPNPSLNLLLDLRKPLAGRLNVRAGVEGWVGQYLVLRAGYGSLGPDLKAGTGTDVLAGVTTGLGVRWQGYDLDYCFVPMVALGMAHRISLSFSL